MKEMNFPKRNLLMKVVRRLLSVLVLVSSAGACTSWGWNLPFETIEWMKKPYLSQGYPAREPGIVVVASQDEIANLGDWVNDEAKTKLQELDWDGYFVLAAFMGFSEDYDITIERVRRRGSEVAIRAYFNEPGPRGPITMYHKSPYHLIQVQKDGSWGQEIRFELLKGRDVVASASHYIP